MENTTSETPALMYTLREKYFQVEPENRIRRYQYFTRILVPGILYALSLMIILPILLSVFKSFLPKDINFIVMVVVGGIITYIITQTLSLIITLITGKNLIIKRCHDFGSDGRIALNIFKAQIILTALGITLGVIYFVVLMGGSNFAETLGNLMSKFNLIQSIVSIAYTILMIVLVFRPGNNGENQYGKDPRSMKVGFLG